MIDVVIDLILHFEGPMDSPSTHLYIYNRPIDPLAADGTVIIATIPVKNSFEQQREIQNRALFLRDRCLQWPQYSVQELIIYR